MSDEPPSFPNDCCPNQKSCTCFDWDNITIPIAQHEALMAGAFWLLKLRSLGYVSAGHGGKIADEILSVIRATGIEIKADSASYGREIGHKAGCVQLERSDRMQRAFDRLAIEEEDNVTIQREALLTAHRVLTSLVKPNPNESALHVFAHAVEAETKVRAALRAAGIDLEEKT